MKVKERKDSFYDVGVVGNIMRKVSLPDGKIKVLFQGLTKGYIKDFDEKTPIQVEVDKLVDEEYSKHSVDSIVDVLIEQVKKLSRINSKFPSDLIKNN